MEKSTKNQYKYYVLAMLTIVYVFNFIDRQLLVILQEAIKKELQLSDTQLGLLTGFTFAIFYVSLGIPLARLADTGNRRNMVAISLGIWSLMTAISGFVQNYLQLLLARIGVGVGEAGGSPPAHAMISDYFPPEKRSTALSIYSTGIYIGILIGFILGGYLNESLGWRTAFFVLGLPGILFSILFYLTVKEPVRGALENNQNLKEENFTLVRVFKFLLSNQAFVFLALASGFQAFCQYGISNWSPSFLARLHGLKGSQIGLYLGLIYGIAGGLGTYAGGLLTDYFGKNNKSMYLKIPSMAIFISIPFIIATLFLQNLKLCLACLFITTFWGSIYLGPAFSIAHRLVPANMRAMSSAILLLVINLIGLGFGPLTVGLISDALKQSMGAESIRWAMASLSIVALLASTLFYVAAKKHTNS